jgi:hypothetical protein
MKRLSWLEVSLEGELEPFEKLRQLEGLENDFERHQLKTASHSSTRQAA